MVDLRNDKVPYMYAPMINLSILLLFLLLLLFPMQVNSYSYFPVNDFAVNCGSSGKRNYHGQNWVGDIDPKLFSTIETQTVLPSLNAVASSSPSVEEVPFGTARLFLSQFTYSFPLTSNGPMFVRLHFYPTTYPNFEPYNSLLSVVAGNFTLLKDFNASLWLLNHDETVYKEYCINVEASERLNITFIPSTSHHLIAYAFINGIEVVSMPPFMFPTTRGLSKWVKAPYSTSLKVRELSRHFTESMLAVISFHQVKILACFGLGTTIFLASWRCSVAIVYKAALDFT